MNDAAAAASALLKGFSLEITGKDAHAIDDAADLLPPGTSVNVTFLGNEDPQSRIGACQAALARGLRPVPHLPARRLRSLTELEVTLAALQAEGVTDELFVVGGDPTSPAGPFEDALSLIRTGILPEYGVTRVGIAGYPDGHPEISDETLWDALADKISALKEQSLGASITTQFGFDAMVVTEWIAEVRYRGFDLPVRVGVPGPAGIRRLLGYARRFGVRSSAGIVSKYGFSLANLVGSAGPDRFIANLAGALTASHGEVAAHFYTFGGVRATAEWVATSLKGHQ
jgi:methylenetetrahydrofolate reductase (NADPH)